MKAYKIVDSDGLEYEIWETRPTEAELKDIADTLEDREINPVTCSVEVIEADWTISSAGFQYLADEAELKRTADYYKKLGKEPPHKGKFYGPRGYIPSLARCPHCHKDCTSQYAYVHI